MNIPSGGKELTILRVMYSKIHNYIYLSRE